MELTIPAKRTRKSAFNEDYYLYEDSSIEEFQGDGSDSDFEASSENSQNLQSR